MKKIINNFLHNKFIQGGAILTATNFLVGFLNYLFNSLSGKLLGPAKYSEITALFSYLVIFAVPASVIHAEIIRRLGAAGKKKFALIKIWEEWFSRTLNKWRFLLIIYLLLFFFIVPPLTNLTLLYSITLMVLLLMTLLSIFYTSAMLGLRMFFLFAIVLILSTLVKLLGPFFVYFRVDGITTIALFIMASSVMLVISSKIAVAHSLRSIKAGLVSNKRLIHVLFNKQIIIMTLSIVSILLMNNLDVIYVKKFYSAQNAGLYGAWNLFSKVIYYILSPILSITYIFFTSSEFEKKHFVVFLINSILLTVLGIVLFLVYVFGADFLVNLIFSDKYSYIVSILPQAAVFGTLFVAINFINGYFVAKKSLVSLTTLFFIPFYAFCLLFFGKKIESVVTINLLFSFLIVTSYLILFLAKLYFDYKSSQKALLLR